MTKEAPPILKKYRFTVDTYHRMADAGLFPPETRVELIDGEIIEMSPIKSSHADCVDKLSEWLIIQLHQHAVVRVQNPITLDVLSEPEPDLAVVIRKPGGYKDAHPAPKEVLLLIEVADTSLEKGRNIKLPLYAAAGIPEAWLVNLPEQTIEVHTEPSAEGYSSIHIYRKGDTITTPSVKGLSMDKVLTA
ncbi:MAG: Uma2 family endonuclease [Phaeodactylibacter sp.]|nr:Uma2 family endonuclease [Phaeodactylibacter sp.]MCB9276598.1 Uma2 family endonuclease [Lewinellaceae bacterium]